MEENYKRLHSWSLVLSPERQHRHIAYITQLTMMATESGHKLGSTYYTVESYRKYFQYLPCESIIESSPQSSPVQSPGFVVTLVIGLYHLEQLF